MVCSYLEQSPKSCSAHQGVSVLFLSNFIHLQFKKKRFYMFSSLCSLCCWVFFFVFFYFFTCYFGCGTEVSGRVLIQYLWFLCFCEALWAASCVNDATHTQISLPSRFLAVIGINEMLKRLSSLSIYLCILHLLPIIITIISISIIIVIIITSSSSRSSTSTQ